jgi:hypothetical protein
MCIRWLQTNVNKYTKKYRKADSNKRNWIWISCLRSNEPCAVKAAPLPPNPQCEHCPECCQPLTLQEMREMLGTLRFYANFSKARIQRCLQSKKQTEHLRTSLLDRFLRMFSKVKYRGFTYFTLVFTYNGQSKMKWSPSYKTSQSLHAKFPS